MKIYCQECNAENELGTLFCRTCGAKIDVDASDPALNRKTRLKRFKLPGRAEVSFCLFIAAILAAYFVPFGAPDMKPVQKKAVGDAEKAVNEIYRSAEKKDEGIQVTVTEEELSAFLSVLRCEKMTADNDVPEQETRSGRSDTLMNKTRGIVGRKNDAQAEAAGERISTPESRAAQKAKKTAAKLAPFAFELPDVFPGYEVTAKFVDGAICLTMNDYLFGKIPVRKTLTFKVNVNDEEKIDVVSGRVGCIPMIAGAGEIVRKSYSTIEKSGTLKTVFSYCMGVRVEGKKLVLDIIPCSRKKQ